jgi:hypothetical protein
LHHNRVPHLHDGLIVVKVGIRAKHEPLSSTPSSQAQMKITFCFKVVILSEAKNPCILLLLLPLL